MVLFASRPTTPETPPSLQRGRTEAASREAEIASATQALTELTALRAEHLRLMHAVSDGDADAEMLLRFHEEHARYARLTANRELEFPMMSVAERDRELQSPDPLRYFVVELSPEERVRRGVSLSSPMVFDHTTKVLYVHRGVSFQPQFAGAIILHEVQHAYDRLRGREPQWATIIDRAPGERRAYRLETRLLRRQTMGALDTLLERMLRARGTSSTCVLPADITAPEREAYRSFFPGLGSGDALDYRMAIFDLAVMVNFERARQGGLGDAYEIACIVMAEQSPQM